jgi:general secretion pathway protein K
MRAALRGGRLNDPRGMVLVAVLWIVAALSLIVTGMIHSVRGEVRQVAVSNQMAQGAAVGGGAIAIVLQGMVSPANPRTGYARAELNVLGRDVSVRAMALTGFIDINTAQPPLLEKLFTVAAGLPPDRAGALAQAVVAERSRMDPQGRPLRLEAVEDLLRIPSLDYDVYATVADLLTTDARGSGRVNVMAAPVGVLAVLANGNMAIAKRIHEGRDAGAVGLDTTALDPQLVDNAPSRRYLVQARVPLPDGASLLTSRWVDLGDGRQEGLPWRIFHADNRLEAAAP